MNRVVSPAVVPEAPVPVKSRDADAGRRSGPILDGRRVLWLMDLFGGLTITDVARASGLSRSLLSKLLAGRMPATHRAVQRLAIGVEKLAKTARIDGRVLTVMADGGPPPLSEFPQVGVDALGAARSNGRHT